MCQKPMNKEKIYLAYATHYAEIFDYHHFSGEPHSREKSAQAAIKAIHYFIKAKAFNDLDYMVSHLVHSHHSAVLKPVINELTLLLEKRQLPPDIHLMMALYKADALQNMGQSTQALDLYQQVLQTAKENKDKNTLSLVYHNMGNALLELGNLSEAKKMYLNSAKVERESNDPIIYSMGSEIAALRVDVIRGNTSLASLQLQPMLEQLRAWWKKGNCKDEDTQYDNSEVLSATLITAIDIAKLINESLRLWRNCLALVREVTAIYKIRGDSQHTIATNQFNQHNYLLHLGRLDDVRDLLLQCEQIFKQEDDLYMLAKTLSALGATWYQNNDTQQAIALQHRALTLLETIPSPEDCSSGHQMLAGYYFEINQQNIASQHLLAELIYDTAMQNHQHLNNTLENVDIIFKGIDLQHIFNTCFSVVFNSIDFLALQLFLKESEVDPKKIKKDVEAILVDHQDIKLDLNNTPKIETKKNQSFQQELQIKLEQYRKENRYNEQSKVLFELADYWEDYAIEKAIRYAFQALKIEHQQHNIEHIANAHGRLGIYFYQQNNLTDSANHVLSELFYELSLDNWENIDISVHNMATFIQESRKSSHHYILPSLTSLLPQSCFSYLAKFSLDKKIDIEKNQMMISQLLAYKCDGIK